jgi:hypothetical protein
MGQTNETMAESDKQSKSGRDNDDDSRTGAATNKKAVGCGLSGQNAPKWPKCGRATDAETMGQTVQATDRGAATTNGHEWPPLEGEKERTTGHPDVLKTKFLWLFHRQIEQRELVGQFYTTIYNSVPDLA